MVAAFFAFLVLWCLHSSAAGAELLPPHNVTVISLNTNYTLRWDWDQFINATFTVEYVGRYRLTSKKGPKWYKACEKTSHRSCDLTPLNLYYFSIYMLRVRVNVNENHSDWVLKQFCPDEDADVGPPSKVDLIPAGSDLDVYIIDPMTSTNVSMKDKDYIPDLYYQIIYWERTADTQAVTTLTLTSKANIVTLPRLKAWTWYCVSVQSRYDFYSKSSQFTSPHCMSTEGPVPWWKIFLYFVCSLVICFLLVLFLLLIFFRCFRTIKATFFPSSQLPGHFKEYFCDSPGSDIPRLLSPGSEAELLCDRVSICPEPVFLEIHDPPLEAQPAPPSGLEADSRHSRQGSSGSRDSGVYSTEGGSGLRQPSSAQSCTEAEDSWQVPVKLEQVKMQDMAACLVADEGVVDMCV
ncbi:hypothetical protein PAMA_003605 [Pampus argenteus]